MQENSTIIDFLRNSWFLIVFIGGLVYWAAKQDSSLSTIERDEIRITELERRANSIESGLEQMKSKIDGIKDDVHLIKAAVIK